MCCVSVVPSSVFQLLQPSALCCCNDQVNLLSPLVMFCLLGSEETFGNTTFELVIKPSIVLLSCKLIRGSPVRKYEVQVLHKTAESLKLIGWTEKRTWSPQTRPESWVIHIISFSQIRHLPFQKSVQSQVNMKSMLNLWWWTCFYSCFATNIEHFPPNIICIVICNIYKMFNK